eukprot:TRINITY_DN18589_c0_g1_i1.p1 TRINITY_DN18589_c0_g1~~TRINITY_DN18589_c0_g1_i1.p1  ORF type:complete len:366 (-),score=73.89 TRINITY_DN18589_c0_g1_i1:108-1205(-)
MGTLCSQPAVTGSEKDEAGLEAGMMSHAVSGYIEDKTACTEDMATRHKGRFVTKTAAEQEKIDQQRGERRAGFSAKGISDQAIKDYVKPVHPKSSEEENCLKKSLLENSKAQVLCGHLGETDFQDVLNAFFVKNLTAGHDIIKQGEQGDCMYICESGSLDIFVARPGAAGEVANGGKGAKVLTVGPGALFGELSLMYSCPRQATVTVTSDSAKLWALGADDFKMLLIQQAMGTFFEYEGWLKDVEILQSLNRHELEGLAAVMDSHLVDENEEIIRQGEAGDKFYLLEEGECAAYISGPAGEKMVKQYTKVGDYFGEVALLSKVPRSATIRAGPEGCSVVSFSAEDFNDKLAPIMDLLRANASKYP